MLRPLDSGGLVRLVLGEDRRTNEVSLTALGDAAVAEAVPLWQAVQGQVASELVDERLWLLRDGLSATLSAIGAPT